MPLKKRTLKTKKIKKPPVARKKSATKKVMAIKKKSAKKATSRKKVIARKKAPSKRVAKKRLLLKAIDTSATISSLEVVTQARPVEPVAPPQPFIDRGEALPSEYIEDKITALVRDPNWIFVYWELAGTKKEEIKSSHGAEIYRTAQWVLRVKNLTNNSHQDIPILLDSKTWYLNVESNCSYTIELGIISREHQFICLLQSNTVQTPRADASGEIDDKWMIKDQNFKKFLDMCAGIGAVPTSPGGPKPYISISSPGMPIQKKQK